MVLDADSRRRFEALVHELAQSPSSRRARQERDELLHTLACATAQCSPHPRARGTPRCRRSTCAFGPDGEPVAAIGVHGLPHQIKAERLAHDIEAVTQAARRASQRLCGAAPRAHAG